MDRAAFLKIPGGISPYGMRFLISNELGLDSPDTPLKDQPTLRGKNEMDIGPGISPIDMVIPFLFESTDRILAFLALYSIKASPGKRYENILAKKGWTAQNYDEMYTFMTSIINANIIDKDYLRNMPTIEKASEFRKVLTLSRLGNGNNIVFDRSKNACLINWLTSSNWTCNHDQIPDDSITLPDGACPVRGIQKGFLGELASPILSTLRTPVEAEKSLQVTESTLKVADSLPSPCFILYEGGGDEVKICTPEPASLKGQGKFYIRMDATYLELSKQILEVERGKGSPWDPRYDLDKRWIPFTMKQQQSWVRETVDSFALESMRQKDERIYRFVSPLWVCLMMKERYKWSWLTSLVLWIRRNIRVTGKWYVIILPQGIYYRREELP